MKKYKIDNFGNFAPEAPGQAKKLLNNTLNLLLGASLAMHLYKLRTTYAGEKEIFFETNDSIFVSALRQHLSNYGVNVTEIQ